MLAEDFNRIFKFVIIGEAGTGKTCLLKRFTQNKFDENSSHTIGAEFGSKCLTVFDTSIKVQIWDTAGQERFRSMTQSYYRDAVGILLVYDVSNRESFNRIGDWLISIESYANQDVEVMLIGNKIDIDNSFREVTYDEGQTTAIANNLKFLETSAKTGDHVEEVFIECTGNILSKIRHGQLDMDRIAPRDMSGTLRNVSLVGDSFNRGTLPAEKSNRSVFDQYIENATISTNNLSSCCRL